MMNTMPPGFDGCLPDEVASGLTAAALNRSCFCIRPDLAALRSSLAATLSPEGVQQPLTESHPSLFSSLPVFVSAADSRAMAKLIAAVETVVASPAYQGAVLADAPPIASQMPVVPSALHGYDFHLTEAGPRLIEINTNAGGAMLVNSLLSCLRCSIDRERSSLVHSAPIEERLWQTFLQVWRDAGREGVPEQIAIVDDRPATQYLYPEFVLFKKLFEQRGVRTCITDPRELTHTGGALRHAGARIDLVYNRLTDFYLQEPDHKTLRDAILGGEVLATPNPRGHALYANKRNLALLTDTPQLAAWGIPQGTIDTLAESIPRTIIVQAQDADLLWRRRKHLFFKPASGYGSRAAYRGDKLTRTVFNKILHGNYVAQTLIPPSLRTADPEDPSIMLKFDVRNYVCEGTTVLQAARLYAGQTTNFRTPGGGFAPLITLPD